MSVNKKIAWQSWNAVVEEIYEKNTEIEMLEELLLAQDTGISWRNAYKIY